MKFSDIPAHDSVKKRLTTLVDIGRMPHALLLEGGAGIGKFALARALAQYIHCTDKQNGDSCGKCPSCIQHQTFNHIDTHFSFPVIKKKNSSTPPISDDYIEEWRDFLNKDLFMDYDQWLAALGDPTTKPTMYVTESDSLISKLTYTAHNSKYKIILMWLPEKMNEQCANKLLKLIEEPFGDTIFIMTSDGPGAILPTIYSRCQRIQMKRFTDDEVAGYLMSRYACDSKKAYETAHISAGSMTDAIKQLSVSDMGQKFLQWFITLMRLSYQRKIVDLKKWAYEIAATGREQQLAFLKYCERMMRENFIYNLNESSLIYLNNDESAFSRNFARFINERNVMKLRRVFNDAIIDVSGYTNSKFVFFDVAIRVILLLKS